MISDGETKVIEEDDEEESCFGVEESLRIERGFPASLGIGGGFGGSPLSATPSEAEAEAEGDATAEEDDDEEEDDGVEL